MHQAQKVLMIVDIVFPGWSPFKDLATAEDIPAFIEIHDDILQFDFDVLVSGHVTRLGTPADVQIQKEYVTDMFNNVRIAAGMIILWRCICSFCRPAEYFSCI